VLWVLDVRVIVIVPVLTPQVGLVAWSGRFGVYRSLAAPEFEPLSEKSDLSLFPYLGHFVPFGHIYHHAFNRFLVRPEGIPKDLPLG
jgi:hypothetical protein